MEVTESLSEGLKRELKIVLAANELEDQLATRLNEIKGQVRLNGFRPGKVPVSHIRKIYGRSVMAEVVQQAVTDSSQKALDERSERPAYQPEISLPEDQDKMESVMEGQADLSYTMAFEIVPEFEIQDFSALKLEKRPTTEVEDSHIDESILPTDPAVPGVRAAGRKGQGRNRRSRDHRLRRPDRWRRV